MQGHRVNLTLAAGDYRRLVEAAAADGKSPSAFAADLVKAVLLHPILSGGGGTANRDVGGDRPQSPRPPEEGLPSFDDAPPPEPPLSRQERRAAERKKGKKRG